MASPRRILAVVQPFVTALAFVLLGALLVRQWGSLGQLQWRARPSWVAASGLLLLIGWAVEIRIWQRLLELADGRLGYWQAGRVWFTATIGRYIPGNIWQPLNLTVLCREQGIRPEATLASLSLFHIVHLAAIGLLSASYLASGRGGLALASSPAGSRWLGATVAGVVVIFLVRPGVVLGWANAVLRRLGRDTLSLRLPPGRLLVLFLASASTWVVFSVSFAAMTAAVADDPGLVMARVVDVAATYPIAYAIGFFSLITPSGLVVREAMLYLQLTPIVGHQTAIVAPLLMRASEVALEGLVTGTLLAYAAYHRRRAPAPAAR